MTFTTPYVTIGGIPSAVPTRIEYTNANVANSYLNSILAFVNVLQIQPTASEPIIVNLISAGNVNQINAALFKLTNLAKYGVIVTSSGQVFFPSTAVSAGFLAAHNLTTSAPPSAGKSTFTVQVMTMTMAQNYDIILRSLAAVGVDINAAGNNFPSLNLDQLKQWRDLAIQVSAIARVVQGAELEGFAGAKTLQGMIEVDYVQTGNQIISKNMADLKTALNVTQEVLASLAQLQGLHNQITTQSSTFSFPLDNPSGLQNVPNAPSAWSAIYQNFASAFFNRPVTPIIISTIAPGSSGFRSAYLNLVTIRNKLTEEFKQLSAISPASTLSNPTSLYGTLKKVLGDLNSKFVVNGQPILSTTPPGQASAGFRAWMLDNYSAFNSPNANQAGQIQQNITFAITAAENLNDTQKETVRNFMFIFEEYYKSAAAALQAISQIIQKMAQNIAR